MSIIARGVKQALALSITFSMLFASSAPPAWAVVRVAPGAIGKAPLSVGSAGAAISGAARVGSVHLGSQQMGLLKPVLGGDSTLTIAPRTVTGQHAAAFSGNLTVQPQSIAFPAGSAAAPAALGEGVERHPVLKIINQLQDHGINLNELSSQPQDIAALRDAIEKNVPEGQAKTEMLHFAAGLAAAGGAGANAGAFLSESFDGVDAGLMHGPRPAVEATKAGGFWSFMSRVPLLGRMLGAPARAEKAREKAEPMTADAFKLSAEQLRYSPAEADLPATTEEIPTLGDEIVGQDQALADLEDGLRKDGRAYNVIVTGPDGSGRETAVRLLTQKIAPAMPTPKDIVSATNFGDREEPVFLRLAAGNGKPFKAVLAKVLATLKGVLPKQLMDGPVAAKKKEIHEAYEELSGQRQSEFNKKVVAIKQDERFGVALIPNQEEGTMAAVVTIDGQAVPESAVDELIAAEAADDSIPAGKKLNRARLDAAREALRPKINELLKELQALMKELQAAHMEAHQQMAQIDQQVAAQIVSQIGRALFVLSEDEAMSAFRKRMQERQARIDAEIAKVKVLGKFGLLVEQGEDGLQVAATYTDPKLAELGPLAQLFGAQAQIPVQSAEMLAELKAQDASIPRELTYEQLSEAVVESARAFLPAFNKMNQENKADHESLPEPSADARKAQAYVKALLQNLVKHYEDFLPQPQPENPVMAMLQAQQNQDPAKSYRADVLQTNAPGSGAPVVFLEEVTVKKLFGYVAEGKVMIMPGAGAVKTESPGGPEFIPGAVHAANEGILVIDLMSLLRVPGAYPAFVQMLRTGKAKIGENGIMSVLLDKGENYEIPVSLKVVFIGSPYLKMLLKHYDEDFGRLFKMAAEFERSLKISQATVGAYLRFLRNQIAASAGKIPHFSGAAAGALLEYAARQADNNGEFTAQFGLIAHKIQEAAFYASERLRKLKEGGAQPGRELVEREDVEAAVDKALEREGLMRRKYQEMYWRDVFHVQTEGTAIGQINALSVIYGEWGLPGRTSATVNTTGQPGVFDVEKIVGWSGESYNKGGIEVESMLYEMFGADGKSFPAQVRIAKEQLYGGIDGDSSTSTRLYAAVSAIARVGVRQGIAITGSADQFGNVQPIGGVNQKIEGFFDVLTRKLAEQKRLLGEHGQKLIAQGESLQQKGSPAERQKGAGLIARGKELLARAEKSVLDGSHGVMIPRTNAENLMLRKDIVEAVRAGKFNIWAVDHVSQGLEILTGEAYSEIVKKGKENLAKMRMARKRG